MSDGVMELEKTEELGKMEDKTTMKVVKVKALLFARARELAGTSELDLIVPEGTTTAECVTELTAKFPPLVSIQDCIVVALNYNYLTEPVKVKDGDELAIIPPISGG